MKYIYSLILFCVTAGLIGCVDDYTDYNPPGQKNGPFVMLSASGNDNIVLTSSQPLNTYTAYVQYGGGPVEITVNVIDAPGTIGSASVTSSIEEFGTVELDEPSFNAVKGKTSGSFKFTFTPSTTLPTMADRGLNLEVAVSDTQLDSKGKESPVTSTITIPVTLVSGPCLSKLAAGQYKVTSASGILDGGEAYNEEDLIANSQQAFAGDQVVVTITAVRPGVYTISEISGGVVPIVYGWTNPAVRVNVCGNTITGRTNYLTFGDPLEDGGDGERTYTVDGTVNTDGTITINWSYVGEDFETPTDAAHGTYTLTKFP